MDINQSYVYMQTYTYTDSIQSIFYQYQYQIIQIRQRRYINQYKIIKTINLKYIKYKELRVHVLQDWFILRFYCRKWIFTEKELQYIFKHELQHFYHHDLWLNMLCEIIMCFYWWNPFAYFLKVEIQRYVRIRKTIKKINGSTIERKQVKFN